VSGCPNIFAFSAVAVACPEFPASSAPSRIGFASIAAARIAPCRGEPLSLKLLAADPRASRDDKGAERLAHAAYAVGRAETADLIVDGLTCRMPPAKVTKRNKNVGGRPGIR
jgi:hypothetical protein